MLSPFPFSGFGWRIGCIVLSRRWSRSETSTNFVRQNWGEDMNQESSLNLVDRYGESLHSSEVFNPRELKFCEGCGLLLIRLQGSKVQFCADCERQMAIAAGRLQ